MANVFLDQNETFPLAAGANVSGRGGGAEGVEILPDVSNVRLDANIERIDLAQSSADANLQATTDGLEVRDSSGNTVVSVASFNQDADVRFTDGNVTVSQTGATEFTVEGSDGSTQTVNTQSNATSSVSVPLGGGVSNVNPGNGGNNDGGDGGESGGDGGDGGDPTDSGPVEVDASNVGPFDATGADVTYNLTSGSYTAEIAGFESGDILDPFANAAVTVRPDTDQTDGEQEITFADPVTQSQADVLLTGLSDNQDSRVFNVGSINEVFGDGTLLTG